MRFGKGEKALGTWAVWKRGRAGTLSGITLAALCICHARSDYNNPRQVAETNVKIQLTIWAEACSMLTKHKPCSCASAYARASLPAPAPRPPMTNKRQRENSYARNPKLYHQSRIKPYDVSWRWGLNKNLNESSSAPSLRAPATRRALLQTLVTGQSTAYQSSPRSPISQIQSQRARVFSPSQRNLTSSLKTAPSHFPALRRVILVVLQDFLLEITTFYLFMNLRNRVQLKID